MQLSIYCVLSARHVLGLHAHLQEQWMLNPNSHIIQHAHPIYTIHTRIQPTHTYYIHHRWVTHLA